MIPRGLPPLSSSWKPLIKHRDAHAGRPVNTHTHTRKRPPSGVWKERQGEMCVCVCVKLKLKLWQWHEIWRGLKWPHCTLGCVSSKCVCVWVRERERERDIKQEREQQKGNENKQRAPFRSNPQTHHSVWHEDTSLWPEDSYRASAGQSQMHHSHPHADTQAHFLLSLSYTATSHLYHNGESF